MKFKDEVVKAADALNERGDLLEEMQAKATNLVNDSYEYKNSATQVRKTECKKNYLYSCYCCHCSCYYWNYSFDSIIMNMFG